MTGDGHTRPSGAACPACGAGHRYHIPACARPLSRGADLAEALTASLEQAGIRHARRLSDARPGHG